MQDHDLPGRKKSLATHGRTIHLGQKRHKLLRLTAAKSTTEQWVKFVPGADINKCAQRPRCLPRSDQSIEPRAVMTSTVQPLEQSTTSAIRAARFLGAVHTPGSRRDNRDTRDYVCRPFLCRFFSADTGVTSEHFTLNVQRDVACAKDHSPRKEPVKSKIVHQEDAGLGVLVSRRCESVMLHER
jgi:hypothetical protein